MDIESYTQEKLTKRIGVVGSNITKKDLENVIKKHRFKKEQQLFIYSLQNKAIAQFCKEGGFVHFIMPLNGKSLKKRYQEVIKQAEIIWTNLEEKDIKKITSIKKIKYMD